MIQCKDCQYCQIEPEGRKIFSCDPFGTVVEPECLAKWQILRLDMLAASFRSMTSMQEKMAPLQNKIMKYVKRELDDIDESDKWKTDDFVDDDGDPEQFL